MNIALSRDVDEVLGTHSLVDKPVTTHTVATGSGRVDEQGRESLEPSEPMVDLDASLSQELLEIPIGQSVTQIPAHCDQDDLRREPEPGER